MLVLTSGAHRVDTEKVATLVGTATLHRANPDFVRAATGQAIAGALAGQTSVDEALQFAQQNAVQAMTQAGYIK